MSNFPEATFIQGATFIPNSRVADFKLLHYWALANSNCISEVMPFTYFFVMFGIVCHTQVLSAHKPETGFDFKTGHTTALIHVQACCTITAIDALLLQFLIDMHPGWLDRQGIKRLEKVWGIQKQPSGGWSFKSEFWCLFHFWMNFDVFLKCFFIVCNEILNKI